MRFEMARCPPPQNSCRLHRSARWSGTTRDWTPVGAVTLNPERDSVVADQMQADLKQPLAA